MGDHVDTLVRGGADAHGRRAAVDGPEAAVQVRVLPVEESMVY